MLPRPQADPVQQRRAVRGQFLRLALQPGALAQAGAQRVDGVQVLARRTGNRRDGSAYVAPPRKLGRWAPRYRHPRWLTSVIGSYPADLGDPGCTTISVFMQRWLHRLPMPFGPKDHDVVA